MDNERWDDVAERVVQTIFTPAHTVISLLKWRVCRKAVAHRSDTLAESLERQGELDSVGGFAYLAELSKNTPSAANINAYADIVRERAVVREMISVANEIADAGFDPQGRTSEDLLDLPKPESSKSPSQERIKTKGQRISPLCPTNC
ncbi:DnaB-like helicase N-terminal domain-containing protein [Shigella boydii]